MARVVACVAIAVVVLALCADAIPVGHNRARVLIEKSRNLKANAEAETYAASAAETEALSGLEAEAKAKAMYNAGEHWMVADEAFARFLSANPTAGAAFSKITHWGFNSVGAITAFALDLYGDLQNTISDGFNTQCSPLTPTSAASLPAAMLSHATTVWNTVYNLIDTQMTSGAAEAKALQTWVTKELDAINAARKAGSATASTDAYLKVGDMTTTMGQDLITQGRDPSHATSWWFSDTLHSIVNSGRLLDLAKVNVDHFVPCNQIAYAVAHKNALAAAAAGNLEMAVRWEFMSFHSYTDGFSAGHIRVPRGLANKVCGAVGALATAAHHGEDNKFGLWVKNNKGQSWLAFGDTRLYDNDSIDNREVAVQGMVVSLNEVFAAYNTKTAARSSYAAIDYLPTINPQMPNHPALLIAKGDVMYYRDTDNSYKPFDNLLKCPAALLVYTRSQKEVKDGRLENGQTPKVRTASSISVAAGAAPTATSALPPLPTATSSLPPLIKPAKPTAKPKPATNKPAPKKPVVNTKLAVNPKLVVNKKPTVKPAVKPVKTASAA